MGAGPAVLVTGAAGYVGRLCVAALAKRLDELSALVALDWTEVDRSERLPGVVYHQDVQEHWSLHVCIRATGAGDRHVVLVKDVLLL